MQEAREPERFTGPIFEFHSNILHLLKVKTGWKCLYSHGFKTPNILILTLNATLLVRELCFFFFFITISKVRLLFPADSEKPLHAVISTGLDYCNFHSATVNYPNRRLPLIHTRANITTLYYSTSITSVASSAAHSQLQITTCSFSGT